MTLLYALYIDDRAELRAELARAARDERAGAARGGAAAVALARRVALRLDAGDYVGFFREYRAAALAARSVTDADSGGGGDGGGGGGGGAAAPPPPRDASAKPPSHARYLLDFLVARVRRDALAAIVRAYSPTLPVRAAARWLGFADEASCARFLRGARATLVGDAIDCRASRASAPTQPRAPPGGGAGGLLVRGCGPG